MIPKKNRSYPAKICLFNVNNRNTRKRNIFNVYNKNTRMTS